MGCKSLRAVVKTPTFCRRCSSYHFEKWCNFLLDHPSIEGITIPCRRFRTHDKFFYLKRIEDVVARITAIHLNSNNTTQVTEFKIIS